MTKIIKLYNKMHKHYTKKHKRRALFYQKLIRFLFNCELPCGVVMGSGTELMHGGLGIVIHQKAVIGSNCKIYQHVTIAGSSDGGVPVVGNNVLIGTGAFLMGDIKIGDNAKIGAHTVVLTDVPPGKTIVGQKGKIL